MDNKITIDKTRVLEYNQERTKEDFDLVSTIYRLICLKKDQFIGEMFLNDPDVISVKNKKPTVQQVILIKYFTNLLLRYRAYGGYCVTDTLFKLYLRCTPIEWCDVFCKQVLGFIDVGKVYETITKGKL